MSLDLHGLHHVTAIAGDPQRNVDFYAGLLGLRLVKRTVNFDDPGSYHFYYGDALGRPGSLLTFFAWPGAPRGRAGAGQPSAVAFAVPTAALAWWKRRLGDAGVQASAIERRLGEELIAFPDPDGMRVELVGEAGAESRAPWTGGPVPAARAIRGLHGTTLMTTAVDRSAALLTGVLGFEPAGEGDGRFRFRAGAGGRGALLDLVACPGAPRGSVGAGAIHHVAWRTPDDDSQQAWQEAIADAGHHVTDVQDRRYFRSIYFREPGGTLFEIATDPPGITVDETPDSLGSALRLPPWLEPMRARIEADLRPVRVPSATPA